MFIKIIFLLFLFSIQIFSTSCCDGSYSSSTGRGTCSHHGGVCSGGGTTYTNYSPTAPTNLSIECKNNYNINLTWDNSPYSLFYEVYYSSTCNSFYTYLDKTYLNNYHTNLNTCNVCFKIKSCNSTSCSNYSRVLESRNNNDTINSDISSNTINNIDNKNSSIFDGAGSLISPNKNCYGCNKDVVKMQEHSGKNSTVVFQWRYDKNTCSQLDITSEESIGNVILKSKSWNGDTIEKSEKIRLNAGIPITIKRPVNNKWITFSITTTKPLKFSNMIYANCRTSDDIEKVGIRSNIEKDLVEVSNNYFWSGTGSLISFIKDRGSNQFGINKDYAITFKKHKSLTSFQWYASSSCSKLEIKNVENNNIKSFINKVSIKKWDEKKWSSNKCSSTLPCILNAYEGEGYYIIKILSDINSKQYGILSAECIE